MFGVGSVLEVLDIFPGNAARTRYGAAIDIGTTTVAAVAAPNPAELAEAESALDIEALVTLGLENALVRDFKFEAGTVSEREVIPHRYQKLLARRRAPAQPAPPSAVSAKL